MDNYIGEIRVFPFGIVPKGWAPCDGRILNVAQNQALFALLGNMYGGNGSTNFALPDLRGRTMLGTGVSARSGVYYTQGKANGSETETLTNAEMPMHSHNLMAMNSAGKGLINNSGPKEMIAQPVISGTTSTPNTFTNTLTSPTSLFAASIENTGGGQGHENRVPLLALNVCIALTGVWPSRN